MCSITGRELLAVAATPGGQAELPPGWHDEQLDMARRDLGERLSRTAADVWHSACVVDGDTALAIRDTADRVQASLVVVGARQDGGAAPGSDDVAHDLSHHLGAPLVIVPSPGGPLRGGTIVVGVDGAEGSRAALDWAISMARQTDGTVHAVFAYDPMADSYPHGNTPNWKYRGQADAEAELEAADNEGVRVTFTLVGEDPVEALSMIGAEDDAALIAVGTKGGLASLGGHVLGRVAAQLPDKAGRPVAIVHEASIHPEPEHDPGAGETASGEWHRIKGRIEQLAGWLASDRTVEAKGAAEARTGHAPSDADVNRARRNVKHRYGEDLATDPPPR
jgi:nucleotide-binding universal stress UspA family protein